MVAKFGTVGSFPRGPVSSRGCPEFQENTPFVKRLHLLRHAKSSWRRSRTCRSRAAARPARGESVPSDRRARSPRGDRARARPLLDGASRPADARGPPARARGRRGDPARGRALRRGRRRSSPACARWRRLWARCSWSGTTRRSTRSPSPHGPGRRPRALPDRRACEHCVRGVPWSEVDEGVAELESFVVPRELGD